MAAATGTARAARFAAGDPIRAIAALMVLVFHASLGALVVWGGNPATGAYDVHYGDIAGPILRNLELGLYIFFALSGYLLGRPFVLALAGAREMPNLRVYARHRLLRIVPAFWVVFVLTLAYFGPRGAPALDVLAVPAFLQNYRGTEFSRYIGQAWTLDVEIAFYLWLPVAALAASWFTRRLSDRRLRLGAILAAVAAVYLASLAWRGRGPVDEEFRRHTMAMLFAFMPGIAMAALEPVVLASERLRRLAPAAALVALAATPFAFFAVSETPPDRPAWQGLASSVFAALVVFAPLAWQWSGRATWRVLDNRVMHWLGVRSYSIYLLHNGIGIAVQPHLVGSAGPREVFLRVLVVMLALTIVGSWALYRWVERPALDWARRSRDQPGDPPPDASARPPIAPGALLRDQ